VKLNELIIFCIGNSTLKHVIEGKIEGGEDEEEDVRAAAG
jgi:hypothetical protein